MDVTTWLSNYWQFLFATVLAVIGIGVSVYLALRDRERKTLDFHVASDVHLLSAHARRLGSSLRLEFAGLEVVDPRILTIRIRNSGTRAIVSDDYETPICIEYEKNPPIDVSVVACAPDSGLSNLKEDPEVRPASAHVAYLPSLMNAGEWFDVQLLSDGPHGEIRVTARFANQDRPMRDLADSLALLSFGRGTIFGVAALVVVAGVVVAVTSDNAVVGFMVSFTASAIVVSLGAMVYGIRSSRVLKQALTPEEYSRLNRVLGE